MTTETEATPVQALAETVLKATLRVITSSGKRVADTDQALAAVRAEVIEFLSGDRYQNERDCIRRGTVNPQVVIASIVASCVLRVDKV